MTINAVDTVKINFDGTRSGGEQWNTGFWLAVGPNGEVDQDTLDDLCDAVASGWVGTWAEMDQYASASTLQQTVRATYYPAGSATAGLQSETPVSLAGAQLNGLHPYECAMVVSLRTAVPTRSGRGRMYLPLDAVPMAAGGQYTAESTGAVSTAMATFFTSVNGITTGDLTLVNVVVASHTQGVTRPVLEIRTDTLPDIQRRRGDSLTANDLNIEVVTP